MGGLGIVAKIRVRNDLMTCPYKQDDRMDIQDVRVGAINLDDAVGTVEFWVEQQAPTTFAYVRGAHGVMQSRCDPQLRAIPNDAFRPGPFRLPAGK